MLAVGAVAVVLAWGAHRDATVRVLPGPKVAPGNSAPHHAPPPPGAPCRPFWWPGRTATSPRVSAACARSGQGYPFSIGFEYIAVSPAAAAPGTRITVWGSCGCGTSTSPSAGAPVERVRLWLLGARRRTITWQGGHVAVNDGRVLLANARIGKDSNWSAEVVVPQRIGAGFSLSRQIGLAPGPYVVMVTYPGEEATAEYYAVAPHEGYITSFVVARR